MTDKITIEDTLKEYDEKVLALCKRYNAGDLYDEEYDAMWAKYRKDAAEAIGGLVKGCKPEEIIEIFA